MGENVNRGKNSAFSLEQSSDREAILRNLLKSTILSLEGVLADAKEDFTRAVLGMALSSAPDGRKENAPMRSCGICSKTNGVILINDRRYILNLFYNGTAEFAHFDGVFSFRIIFRFNEVSRT